MLSVPASDDSLTTLYGQSLPSNVFPGVSYRLERRLGTGSMAVAYLCERRAPDGAGPAVIKLVRPGFVKQAAQTALLTVRKEAVALGRLNETVPPTPFVVRFIENGVVKSYVIGPGEAAVSVTELVTGKIHYGRVTASTSGFWQ